MHVSARADYALRAVLAIADTGGGELVKAAILAKKQQIPLSVLHGILLDLRRADLLVSHRGTDGGYSLSRPADRITVGDVLRAVGGTLTTVRGLPLESAAYQGVATGLRDVWLAVHGAVEEVVDRTSLADLLTPRGRAPQRRSVDVPGDGAQTPRRPDRAVQLDHHGRGPVTGPRMPGAERRQQREQQPGSGHREHHQQFTHRPGVDPHRHPS